jgi:hypothetical protein
MGGRRIVRLQGEIVRASERARAGRRGAAWRGLRSGG